MTKIFLFPGQGSQKAGMGKDLFPRFRDLTDQASEQLGYSIERLCVEDPDQKLNQTEFSQPALYVVNALTYFHRVQTTGLMPSLLAGHSLGEYNALLASGAFDFITGLKLVERRGKLMSKAGNGGMAAVVGLDSDAVRNILSERGLDSLDIANFNNPKQVVLSGPEADIKRAGPVFEAAGASLFMPLKVSGAFHSRYMGEAKREFADFLAGIRFHAVRIPVIANCTAQPYVFSELRSTLANQIDHPVRWVETLEYLLDSKQPEFEEVGPGNVLAGLLKKMTVRQPAPA